jgi:hypothetical protein
MRIARFIPNEPDGEHCLQACYQMAIEALTNRVVSLKDAERETGYVPGRDTWQFNALLGFAANGLYAVDCENFNPHDFIGDIVGTIEKQVGSRQVASKILAETNIESEISAVRSCLANDRVVFEDRIPHLTDLRRLLSREVVVICNINSKRLQRQEGHRGHIVILEEIANGKARIQNPGPPAAENQEVDIEDFVAAWQDPSPSMANYYAVSTDLAALKS